LEQYLDKLPDILSPAGNPAALVSAIYAGANAVYLGMDKFNARMKADNFNQENLPFWVNFCHLFGSKVYVTINTSIKNSEYEEACKLGIFCYENNVDGLIVTDIGLLNFFSVNFPDFDVTLSTQQNIHNTAGAKLAKELGSKRIVLSRETSLVDIIKIKESVDIQLETFLHGALCVSLSGQCLFSSFIDGNSGNRGLCAQPCRQKYQCKINDEETISGYLLSARDLCLVRNLAKLTYAGVDMLKIEGRNRRPQYVAQTTATYRKILDNNFVSSEKDIDDLKKIYNRGNYTNGYLNNNSNIIYHQAQGHIGLKIGELAKIKNQWVAKSNMYLHDGDAFKIFRNNIEVGNAYCTESSKGGYAKLSVSENCKIGDEINITTSISQIAQLDSNSKTLTAQAIFKGKIGNKPTLTLSYNDLTITVEGNDILQQAINYPLTIDAISQQLKKTGNTHFTISNIDIDIDNIFLPVSTLNALRRLAIEKLEHTILINYNAKLNRSNKQQNLTINQFTTTHNSAKESICIYLDEHSKLENLDNSTILIYKPNDYNLNWAKDLATKDVDNLRFLDLPNFATESDYAVLKSILKTKAFNGVVVNNLYGIYLAKELNLKIILGLGMNIFNLQSLVTLAKICDNNYYGYFYSQELTINEILSFGNDDGFIFANGEICLMTLAHCPLHVNLKSDCGKCKYNNQKIVYIDKTNREFSLKRKRIAKCYWELFNCLPLDAGNKIPSNFKILLKPEQSKLQKTYDLYKNKSNNNPINSSTDNKYTTGHLSKKVK